MVKRKGEDEVWKEKRIFFLSVLFPFLFSFLCIQIELGSYSREKKENNKDEKREKQKEEEQDQVGQ